jgi:isopropylmalate/homocitrate/citramalate synthase
MLIHEWDDQRPFASAPEVVDESLRDGLQSPSVRDPRLVDKIEMIHRMAAVGIQAANIGLPGAHQRQYDDALALAREIVRERFALSPYCAARTKVSDIERVVTLSQHAGVAVEVAVFIGSSPIRGYVEDWTLDDLKLRTEEAVSFAVSHGLPVMYVTEDSTRSTPDTLRELYLTALRCGATRLCVTDTVGCSTPAGAGALVRFVRNVVDEAGAKGIGIDWHGHRDRGLDVANAMAAWEAGAQRCHGTVLGIGERSGNTPIELLIVNLHLRGWSPYTLSVLSDYVEFAAGALGIAVPPGQPIVGADAFRTATGTHAAAVLKAERKRDAWLAERVYSCIAPSLLGRTQRIDVGPMSGEANVEHYLGRRGIGRTDDLVKRILACAKAGERVLADLDIDAIVDGTGGLGRDPATARPVTAGSESRLIQALPTSGDAAPSKEHVG